MNQSCQTYETHFILDIIQTVHTIYNVLEYFVVFVIVITGGGDGGGGGGVGVRDGGGGGDGGCCCCCTLAGLVHRLKHNIL